MHVCTVGAATEHAARRWVALVASLGRTTTDGSAVFDDPLAALAAARAGAVTDCGCGVATSPAHAELLAMAAPPGRILLDATIAHHLRAAGVGGVVADLGEHQLADLGAPSRVAEWTEATGAAGPIRSCSVVPTRLGTDRTAFIGRRELRAAVAELIRTERLVSLVGPPGSGKTRPARRVGAELAWSFPGGAWFVDLEPAQHADDIPTAVAATLELTLRAEADPGDEIGLRLARAPSLVVLDNAEQVAGETARFADAVARIAPATVLLVTSRRRLGAAGEHVVPVGPLNLDGDLDDARAILRARVTAAGGAAIDPDDELAVVRQVDGLPLALELVAPQIATLGAATVLDRLDEFLADDASSHRSGRARTA